MSRRSALVAALIASALATPAAAGAAIFAAPQVLDPLVVGGDVTVIAGPSGKAAVTWPHTAYVLGAVRPDATSPFGTAQDLTTGSALGVRSSASAFAPDGTLQTVWIGAQSGQTVPVETGDPAAPTVLDTPTPSAQFVALDIGADGTAATAWETQATVPFLNGGVVRVALRSPGGSWSAPIDMQVSTELGQLVGPSVVVDPDGGVTVAWAESGNLGADQIVAVSHRAPGGSFGLPEQLPVAGFGAVTDLLMRGRADGTETLAVSQGFPASVEVREGTAGHFGAPAIAGTNIDLGSVVQLAGNDRGDLAVAFTAGETATHYARTQVAYRPAGAAWSAPQAIGGCGGRLRGLAVDAQGAALLVLEQRPGSASPQSAGTLNSGTGTLLASLRRPDGVWGVPETVTPPAADATGPALALTTDGRAVLAAHVSRRVEASVTTAPISQLPIPDADDGSSAPFCAIPPKPPIIVPGPPLQIAPAVGLSARLDTHRRRLTVKVRCPHGARPCRGAVGMLAHGRRSFLASAPLDMAPGASRSFVLKPPRKTKLRGVKFTVAAGTAGADGRATVVRRAVPVHS